jgi:alkylhydroperoxidase family enzyme
VRFGAPHVTALRDAGLSGGEIIDVINAAAFFNWANRLMLSLGEPELPKRFR